ncbi:MAG: hypothetical protein K6E51_01190 [Treponema sp.]|nr:hypothetical protein [Treponema sp.]
MSDIATFNQQVLQALDAKTEWYDAKKLPELLDEYRMFHTVIRNLYDLLVKKSCITEDPYKHDKKISEVKTPDDSSFAESDRAGVIGIRFSDYESMLDYICTYYKFSVSYISIERIKALVALNNSFGWLDFSPNNPKPNAHGLAEIMFNLRQESDALTASAINDSISKISKSVKQINEILKELTEFQKEVYKGTIRKTIFEHPNFDKEAAEKSPQDEIAQIRKLYTAVMGKAPFYTALIDEISKEDHGPEKEQRREALLKKLSAVEKKKEKAVQKVDTKLLLLDALAALTAVVPMLDQIIQKVQNNHDALESLNNTIWAKIKKVFRKAFNLPDPPTEYRLYITDAITHTERTEKINYNEFFAQLTKRSRFYTSFSSKASPNYKKIANSKPEDIITFLHKQISECQHLLVQLTALDEFFKHAIPVESGVKVKGLKIELVTLKNNIVKANSRRAEYTAQVEEEAQMQKLGISDEDN